MCLRWNRIFIIKRRIRSFVNQPYEMEISFHGAIKLKAFPQCFHLFSECFGVLLLTVKHRDYMHNGRIWIPRLQAFPDLLYLSVSLSILRQHNKTNGPLL